MSGSAASSGSAGSGSSSSGPSAGTAAAGSSSSSSSTQAAFSFGVAESSGSAGGAAAPLPAFTLPAFPASSVPPAIAPAGSQPSGFAFGVVSGVAVPGTAHGVALSTVPQSDQAAVAASPPAASADPSSSDLAGASTDESDEARYSRHLDLLLKFYAKHDPSKTREQVVAIIAKRKGDAVAMDESLFVDVCGKLENKYGENPLAVFVPATSDSSAAAVDPEMAELLQDDSEEERDEQSQESAMDEAVPPVQVPPHVADQAESAEKDDGCNADWQHGSDADAARSPAGGGGPAVHASLPSQEVPVAETILSTPTPSSEAMTVDPGQISDAMTVETSTPVDPRSPELGTSTNDLSELPLETDDQRYSRHLDLLLKFYAKHDPSKTREQVVAIIAKRKGAAVAMDESLFVDVCGKLENKYGENPLAVFAPEKNETRLESSPGENMDLEQNSSQSVPRGLSTITTNTPSASEVNNDVVPSEAAVSAVSAATVATVEPRALAPLVNDTQPNASVRSMVDTEHDLHRVEQQFYRCKRENEKLVRLCAEQKHQLQVNEKESALRSKTVAEEKRSANAAKLAAGEVFNQKEALMTENAQLRKVLDEKAVAIQARDKELEDFTARVVRTNALKAQAQDDHHEAEMKLQRARRDMSVANEEAELARTQARSSDSEVRRLNEELLLVRKEKSARERELQAEVDKLQSAQNRHTHTKADGTAETAERYKLQVRVRELEADAVKAKADAQEELRSQQKLTQLYKESQEDGDLKAAELQVMLAAKTDECDRLKREHAEHRSATESRVAQLEDQERAANREVEALKQRLEEVREFGDGAFSPPVKDQSGRKRRFDVSGLSESAALAQRYSDVSTTVLASRYEKSQVELRKAKEESKQLQASLDEVLAELEKRAPTVAKIFEEQELMSKKYSELSAKMSEAADQNGGLRKQLREAENFRADAQQHREVLEREIVVLRKQVGQLMSTPVQTGNKRRRGSRSQLTDRPQYRAAGTTLALPAPVAASGSSALVLQDVDGSELNAKQDLERKVIELQVQCETLREANSESALQAKLQESVAELDGVRGQVKQMEEVIDSITRQRDSYMETLKAEIEGSAQSATSPKPASPRKLPPPPSAEAQCMQALASLQADYAKSRAKWSERVDELQGRVESLSKRASSAEIAHAQQQAELEHAKLTASDYESHEKDTEQRLQLVQERAAEADGLVRDLRSKLDAAEADRSLAKAELARATSSLESAERRYEASKSREAALQTQYEEQTQAKNTQAIALANALEARQRDSQARSQEASGLQLKIDELNEDKKGLEAKLHRQQDALEANGAALSSVSKARDGAEELVLSLRASQDGLRRQCAQLSAKLSEDKAAAAAASNMQKVQDGSSLGLTTEEAVNLNVANLRAELASSAEQITSLKQHITDYKQLVQHSESQVKELKRAAHEQTAARATSSRQFSEAEDRCKSLAAELDQAQQKASSSAAALQAKEAEIAAEQAAKGAAERRAAQVQAQLVAKTAELDKATSTLTELKQTSEATNVELARLQDLAKQVEAARTEAVAAQSALSRTEAKGHEAVNAMEKKLDAASAEMRDLRSQNEMLLGQLDRAMNSLATDTWSGGGSSNSETGAAAATPDVDANAEDMNAVVEGLREVVKSLRRGREMAEARLELVQQQALRDKSQVEVLQRELAVLRQQGNTLAPPVESSPRGAPWTEKERAELVGNMAAAQETSVMVEELRAARNQLASQLQTANQAKNAAISAKAVAEKAKEQAELASSRLQATLSVKETEVKMWRTKLEKSTERTKIQQLMNDKKEALMNAKEVATKLENEKKIVKQWVAKHGAKDREATAQKAEVAKQKAEVIKLQSQVTKLQTEKSAVAASALEKAKQLAVKSDEEAKTKADLNKTKDLCKQLLEKVRGQTCPKCSGSAKGAVGSTTAAAAAAATTAASAGATASPATESSGPDKPVAKAPTAAKAATSGAGAKPGAAKPTTAGTTATQAAAVTAPKKSPALGAAKAPAKPTVSVLGGAIGKGAGRGGAARGVTHNRGGGRAGGRGAVLHNRGAKAPSAAKPKATTLAATSTSAAATTSGGRESKLASAPSLSAPATSSASAVGIGSGIGSGIGGTVKAGKLSATAPTFTFGQSSSSSSGSSGISFGASTTSSTNTSASAGSAFVFGKPPSGSGTAPTFTFGKPT